MLLVQVMEEEEETWEGEGQAGIARSTFHRQTQFRLRFAFNSAQARLLGLHPEEAVARFGARDLPQTFTEADGLRYLVAEMGTQALSRLTAYHGCRLHYLFSMLLNRQSVRVFSHPTLRLLSSGPSAVLFNQSQWLSDKALSAAEAGNQAGNKCPHAVTRVWALAVVPHISVWAIKGLHL